MSKAYRFPEISLLGDVDEDIITASPGTGDNDVEDGWGEELEEDF